MPTIIVPTQQQLYDSQHNPNSLLAMYNAANTPAPIAGSPGAVTAAGTPSVPGSTGSNLNNLNNPDWITSMTEMMNQINLKAQQEANASRIPGAAGLEKQSSANIGSLMAGKIPDDVVREEAQRAAEMGVGTGVPLGPGTNSMAGLMQALGLTSLGLQTQGQHLLTEAYGRNPGAPLSNPQALVTTPAQAEALRLQQQNMELDYLARMAAINAANNRTRSGYGGGGGGYPRSGGGGGGFAPATNWQGGSPTPLTQPWHLPYSLNPNPNGTTAGSAFTPGTYTDDMNPLYGYTQQPGLPNTVPGAAPWNPPSLDSWDNLLSGGNAGYNDLTEAEWDDLYGAGG